MTSKPDESASQGVMFVSSIRRYGGGERWMLDAAEGLKDRGHAVHIVSRPNSILGGKCREREIDGSFVQMRNEFDPIAIVHLARLLDRLRPRVICVNLDREIRLCGTALTLARGLYGGQHKATRLIPRRGSEFPLKNKAHYRYFYTRLVDRVIVNSRATRHTMLSRSAWFPMEKAVMIYNGIHVDTFDRLGKERVSLREALRAYLGLQPDVPLIALVGELSERKGHRFVVRAAVEVLRHVPEARFIFVGEGDAKTDIERMIDEHQLRDKIFLLGFRDDVPAVLTASDILILPSRIEGFGYVLIEAMAARLPVVASNASSIPEIVEHGRTGFLHPVGSEQLIVEHLLKLLKDRVLARTMGDEGYRLVREKFSHDRMIDQLEHLFFESVASE